MPSNQDLTFQILIGGVPQTLTSLQQIEKLILSLSKAFKIATTDAQRAAIAMRLDAAKGMQQTMMGATAGLTNLNKVSANASQSLLNLNYVIRDSPYFFNNFAMGVLAIGNNINPLIDRFAALGREAKLATEQTGKLVTKTSLLKQALVGGAGLSIAFSLIVTVIQAYVFSQARANRATKETTEAVKDQIDKLNELSRQELVKARVEAVMKIIHLEDKLLNTLSEEGKEATLQYRGREKSLEILIATNEKERDLISAQKQQIGYIDVLLKGNTTERKIQNEITLLKEKQKDQAGEEWTATQKKIEGLQAIIKSWEVVKEKSGKHLKIAKSIVIQYRTALELWESLQNRTGRDPRAERFATLDSKGEADYLFATEEPKGKMNEFNMALESGKIVAQQLGNTLNQAFMQGKIALDEFLKSLMSAIAQMLILRAITAFLTGGASEASGIAGVATPLAPALPKGLNKGIRVTGQITADKNNFIANIRNADNYYSKNEEFVLIGR